MSDIEAIRKRHAELQGKLERLGRHAGLIESAQHAHDDRGALLRLFDALTAMTSELDEPTGWRPIDSAPKDGTAILGWCEPYGIRLLYWAMGDYWSSSDSIYEPTHWQPLPEAP